MNRVVTMIRRPLDRLFWRQYADEIHQHPEAPSICCLLGMSHVVFIIFIFAIGFLAPVVHLLRYLLGRYGVTAQWAGGFDFRWFLCLCCAAGLIASFLGFRLYWRYRLEPDRAAALDPNFERDEATITAVKLTLAAFTFMGVMETLFR
jgi:hypothetical protein